MQHEGVKPDILILGKALSGGVLPVSAVLANNSVMNVSILLVTPGQAVKRLKVLMGLPILLLQRLCLAIIMRRQTQIV